MGKHLTSDEVKSLSMNANILFVKKLNLDDDLEKNVILSLQNTYSSNSSYSSKSNTTEINYSENQILYFNKLDAIIEESTYEDLNSKIHDLEIEAIDILTDEEEIAFLSSSSVAKQTLPYWFNHSEDWKNLFNNFEKVDKWTAAKKVGKADAAGAAAGASAWGVAGWLGGPVTWTAAGSAIAGGAVGSSVYEAIMTWW